MCIALAVVVVVPCGVLTVLCVCLCDSVVQLLQFNLAQLSDALRVLMTPANRGKLASEVPPHSQAWAGVQNKARIVEGRGMC